MAAPFVVVAFRRVGALVLIMNASIAFVLNLATMQLIKHTSALTLNVSGVFKDVGLILWSVVVSGAIVTRMQYAGYAVAIVGVSAYSAYKRAQQQASAASASAVPEVVKRGYSDARRGGGDEAMPLASSEPHATASSESQSVPAKC